MTKELLADIIDWDIVNWSAALEFWEANTDLQNNTYQCIELGGNKGGLSLWLALKGNTVICSDLSSSEITAKKIHDKYQTGERIRYEAIDATQIPYPSLFDIIAFKSVLGGISRGGNDSLKRQ
ncbi:MAG: methyltransferase domain-containing protein [Bacteroidia bacterium]